MPPDILPPVLLLGHGHMGSALFSGWVAAGIAPSAVITRSPSPLTDPHVWSSTVDALPEAFAPRLIVAAVKPHVAAATLPDVAKRFPRTPILSVMAGRRIRTLAALAGHGLIIRAMPNTPSAIGRGISGVFAPPAVAERDRALADQLLRAVGEVVWLDGEDEIDLVTGVSGSGPAYVFLLAELLEQAGVAIGLASPAARMLARATVSGAGRLLEADGRDAAALRAAVTSKGGTTERALAVLMADDAWPRLVDQAVAASAERARDLAST